jgi:hypothetical protein
MAFAAPKRSRLHALVSISPLEKYLPLIIARIQAPLRFPCAVRHPLLLLLLAFAFNVISPLNPIETPDGLTGAKTASLQFVAPPNTQRGEGDRKRPVPVTPSGRVRGNSTPICTVELLIRI